MADLIEDSNTLIFDLALIVDPNWNLDSRSISRSSLSFSPLFWCKVDVLIFGTLGYESVPDHLGAALHSEVNKLWHSVSTII